MALQVLYEWDITGHDWRGSLQAHAAAIRAPQRIATLAQEYVEGVLRTLQEHDVLIERYAPAWPVAQLPAVDRNLLRLGMFEMRPGSPTPPKVAINEAVELAKLYGGEQSPRFINGVLGAVLEAWQSDRKGEQ